MKRILRPHQVRGVIHGLSVIHPALFWKMRLGKTLTCIRTCLLYRNCFTHLVVGPNPVISSWCDELDKEDQTYFILEGSREKKLQLLNWSNFTNNIWFLINKEGHLSIPSIAGYPWDVVILDESVFISNPKDKVQATKFFTTHFRNVKHRWALCGTPAPENSLQYFPQLQWLDYHLLSEKNFYEFRHNHFQVDNFHNWTITEDGKKYLSYYLNKCAMFLSRKDVHMGGIKIYEKRAIQLSSNLQTIYNKLEKEFSFEIDGNLHETIFATQKYLWMRRICGGFSHELEIKSYHKCNEILNLLKGELKNEQIIIWCEFIEEVLMVYNYFNDLNFNCSYIYGNIPRPERENRRKDFQSGKLQLLIILTSTMCFSSNLSSAGALVYLSSPASALIREQSEDRAIDLSVNDNSLIIDLFCLNTIEEDLLESLIRKESNSMMIERMVKGIQKRGMI